MGDRLLAALALRLLGVMLLMVVVRVAVVIVAVGVGLGLGGVGWLWEALVVGFLQVFVLGLVVMVFVVGLVMVFVVGLMMVVIFSVALVVVLVLAVMPPMLPAPLPIELVPLPGLPLVPSHPLIINVPGPLAPHGLEDPLAAVPASLRASRPHLADAPALLAEGGRRLRVADMVDLGCGGVLVRAVVVPGPPPWVGSLAHPLDVVVLLAHVPSPGPLFLQVLGQQLLVFRPLVLLSGSGGGPGGCRRRGLQGLGAGALGLIL